jgi:hypothetical protein
MNFWHLKPFESGGFSRPKKNVGEGKGAFHVNTTV